MSPVQPTPPSRPAPAAPSARRAHLAPVLAPATAPVASVPLGLMGFLLGVGAVLVAAAVALLLAPLLGELGGAWGAALGAAAGVVAAGVPAGWLILRLARELAPGAGRLDAGAAPAAGMPRALFMALAEREFARARRYGTGAALVLVDVDRFARLSEARGPAAAAVLGQLLGNTAPTLRTADVLTQFSASQMAVFLVHADATGALDVAERIRERAEHAEVPLRGATPTAGLHISVSAGVAHLRPAHLSLQALFTDAQEAVAAARAAGGNCVRAAPVEPGMGDASGPWRERRARPKQGGKG